MDHEKSKIPVTAGNRYVQAERYEGHGFELTSDELGCVLELVHAVRLWLPWDHWATVCSRARHPMPYDPITIELDPGEVIFHRVLIVRGDVLMLRSCYAGGPSAVQTFEVPKVARLMLQTLLEDRPQRPGAVPSARMVRIVDGRTATRSEADPDAWETADGARYFFCAGAHCPGYPIRASRFGHPESCARGRA